jgi:RHS repeat-associated protein
MDLSHVRVALGFEDTTLKVRQFNSYYTFGKNNKEISKSGTNRVYPNEYLYKGKMIQDEQGLNLLDNGVRFYDAILGKWHVTNPLSKKEHLLLGNKQSDQVLV